MLKSLPDFQIAYAHVLFAMNCPSKLNVCICIPHLGLRMDCLGSLCCEIHINYTCFSQISTSDSQNARATDSFEVAAVGTEVATILICECRDLLLCCSCCSGYCKGMKISFGAL